MKPSTIWGLVFATVVIGVALVTLLFSINAAKIKACEAVGGTTVTNFGFVIDCKQRSIFP